MEVKKFISYLEKNALFAHLSVEEILAVCPFIQLKQFEPGTEICKEGEKGKELFLIKRGTVEVLREDFEEGRQYLLSKLFANDYFGEMAYFEGRRRAATVRSVD